MHRRNVLPWNMTEENKSIHIFDSRHRPDGESGILTMSFCSDDKWLVLIVVLNA